MNKKKLVLSLKGGGLKAISQLAILAKIEERTNRKICEVFDVIGGASAGALNASLFSLGYTSEEIIKLYLDKKITIFSRRFLFWKSLYKTSRLKYIIKKYIPDKNLCFKDTLCTLVLISQNINDQVYYTFGSNSTPELLLIDGIMRATAIFPFFEPYEGVWADGGMGNFNNPSEIIVRKLLAHGYSLDEIKVLYLDSGFIPQRYSLINKKTRNIIKYVTWIIDNISNDADKRSHSLFRFYFPQVEYYPFIFTYNNYYNMFERKALSQMYQESKEFANNNIDDIMKCIT